MKQSVFDFLLSRLRILGINIANTFSLETAYPAENWANMVSTIVYTASYLLFLNIIFSNIKTMAGYSKNDMLFFTLIGQFAFYTMYNWSYDNMENLIESVRLGEMDVLLSKPLPTLFYVSTRKISLIQLFRDALLPMLMIGLLINWSALNLSFYHVVIGLIIFACGQWSVHVVQFLLSIPVFWSGQSRALLGVSYTITDNGVPLEGLPQIWKIFFTTIVPVSLPVAVTASIMLGKGTPLKWLILALLVCIFATFVRYTLWKKALAAYNSASS